MWLFEITKVQSEMCGKTKPYDHGNYLENQAKPMCVCEAKGCLFGETTPRM